MFNLRRKKGNALPIVIMIISVFILLVPILVAYVKNEAKWSVKERGRTSAFHVAEAGLDKGSWKINENSTNWTTVVGGGTIAGYANDVVYSDVSGGSYKINIQKASTSSISIVCTSKDAAGKEYRAIKAVYSKDSIVAPVQVPSYSASGNFTVWWGPIYSLGDLTVSGASDELYPRKMARGKIDPRDIDPNVLNVDSNANPEWWSYNSYPVPDPPVPDLVWYEAQSHIAPNEYYATPKSFSGVDTVSKIFWLAAGGDMNNVGVFRRGYLFSMGNFATTKRGGYVYSVTPPADAWKEYVRATPNGAGADSAAQDEYPGDGGYHISKSYTFGTMIGGSPNKLPAFRGLIYVNGTYSGGANGMVHGAIVVAGGGGFGGGGADLFYDDTLNVRFSSSASGVRTSWEEITPTPF